MQVNELKIPGAYEFVPPVFPDSRGRFVAPFQQAEFEKHLGFSLNVAQMNHSVSAKGVVRGMHFAEVPAGQSKYVSCLRGALLDVIVDIRVGSPTFGQWVTVLLDAQEYRSVYIAEGLGHGFVALEDDTAINYLCSTPFNPKVEHGFSPFDPELALPWDEFLDGGEPIVSDKDRAAPTLAEAREAGLLPDYQACLNRYAELKGD
ncbi:dTDP-4-keto-6-deoxy-D-glucose epimerase [Pseudonocardiaceae bacterium YIM PH 21723]|nr:dTDP-4-keto-6-deoxy-D-glucose epimerase [Pseudonocardiaceae bacterium YIM PH 21723]